MWTFTISVIRDHIHGILSGVIRIPSTQIPQVLPCMNEI
jgi:hypothetical protein